MTMADSEKSDVIEEAKRSAKLAVDLFNKSSEICVEKFEKWASEHKEATREEAHKMLVHLVKTAVVSSNMLVMKMVM